MAILHGKHIFIVEDDIMNRTVFQIALGTNGALVEFDRWGRNTLSKIEKHQPDVIILDLMLKNGDSGYDIFEQIRRDKKYDSVPIIAISASEPSLAIPKTKELGFSGFIAKPIDESRLPDQIAQIISGEEIWSSGSRFNSN